MWQLFCFSTQGIGVAGSVVEVDVDVAEEDGDDVKVLLDVVVTAAVVADVVAEVDDVVVFAVVAAVVDGGVVDGSVELESEVVLVAGVPVERVAGFEVVELGATVTSARHRR